MKTNNVKTNVAVQNAMLNADKELGNAGKGVEGGSSTPASSLIPPIPEKANIKDSSLLTLKTAKGKTYDVSVLNKAIADTLANAGRLKSNASLTKVDLAGDGIFDGKAIALLVKSGSITKETANKINAVRKLREAVEALVG